MNWAELGAIAAILALFEVPLLALAGAAYRWACNVDRRLDVIESRSHHRRASDWGEHND